MTVHLLESGVKFMCGARRDGDRSFITVEMFRSGQLRPSGQTQVCPFCKVAYDPPSLLNKPTI